MTQPRPRITLALLALSLGLGLSGCVGMAVGTGSALGVAVAQERMVGAAVDDTAIKIEINHLLFQKSESLFAKVGIDVVEGRVLLTGSVQVPAQRTEAARLAWRANGVGEILNEIQVNEKGSLAAYLNDKRIGAQLRLKILADRDIRGINYTIETVNGVIYLLGIAQSQRELDMVTNHARTIKGAVKVISHVRLKDDPRRRPS